MQAGYAIAYLDESIFALTPHIIRSIFPKGSRPIIKIVNNPHQKICVFGALFSGKTTVKISDKINSTKFLSFIKRLQKNHRKLCIVVDNARWHNTKNILLLMLYTINCFLSMLFMAKEICCFNQKSFGHQRDNQQFHQFS